ncbi:4a-hydroxytetrahydrobiopterin dehydratase [Candidatus Nitrosacidococcus tergens]|uniref:Putative pterin-4-alpha-carbinolamine dehydratase n=1 Tax=Candidatus Nitrosacidococcus tergens TaxID=553981 RepID=A0A7G1Q7E9_9GAMM|nr:4a-hydroxytetrahydrobiopterin dehydratase [Candidatus Nitrosacidococcus tergens]CAB1274355.1 putative pterin-4-alpha-carbinolamine dehydratase [Candidatus Nitrosacidococcus tergens]
MKKLIAMECEACRADSSLITEEEIKMLSPQVSKWNIIEEGNIFRLRRVFSFSDFITALEFTNKVGEIAETYNHHPSILTEYGKVTVTWWTHKIEGLHKNDFVMAAKTDQLLPFS